MEHGEVEVGEGGVVVSLEGDVLAMLEASSGEDDGEVGVVVDVGVAHTAAVEDHRLIEEALAVFFGGCQVGQMVVQELELLAIGLFQLLNFLRGLAVVGEVVIPVGCGVLAVEFEDGSHEGVNHQGDDSGGVGFQGELDH